VEFDWIYPVFIPAASAMIGSYVQAIRTYRCFNATDARDGLTGAQIARALPDENGLPDITVMEGEGRLSDRYNFKETSVSLSRGNYRSISIVAYCDMPDETGGRAIGIAGSGLAVLGRDRNHAGSSGERFGTAVR